MATYDLTGFGVQALNTGLNKLYIQVITYPGSYWIGRAQPANTRDLGVLRLGVGDFYYPMQGIDAGEMVIDVPAGVTNLGYNLFGDTEILVGEGAPPGPPGVYIATNVDGSGVTLPASIVISWGGFLTADVNAKYNVIDDATPVNEAGWSDISGGGYLNPADHSTPPATPQTSGSFSITLHNWLSQPSGDYNVVAVLEDPDGTGIAGSSPGFVITVP